MSNYLAVATATETIAQVIRDAVGPVIPGAEVTTDRPDRASKDAAARVNVYLYQVSPNGSLRNNDLPMRNPDGTLANRPRSALDLYYLINFYGRDEQLIAQQLLGLTVSALHVHGILTRSDITRAVNAAPGGFLNGSDLAYQTEALKISPHALTLEELSKLWSVMFQVPYTLSASFLCSVVFIDGPPAGTALPVRAAPSTTSPGLAPVIDAVASADPTTPIVYGGSVAITGRNLAGGTRVLVDGVVLTPADADVTATQVTVALTDSRLVAGPNQLAVQTSAGTSAPAAFTLSPTLTAVRLRGGRGGSTPSLRMSVEPAVWSDQPVTVLLNGTGAVGGSYAFDLPVTGAAQEPHPLKTVSIPIPGVPSGTYLVRLRVQDAESPLTTATDGQGRTTYVSPRVKVP
jgi:hypothetical protein